MNRISTELFRCVPDNSRIERTECKSVSRDRGRRIHRRDAIEFNHLARQNLEAPAQRLHNGLAVVLTIPGRLSKDFRDRRALAERLGRIVMTAKDETFADGSEVRLFDFDIAEYPDLGPPESPAMRTYVDEITGTQNREVMILGRRNRGGTRVCSSEPSG